MRNSCFFLGLVSLVIARELPISLLYLENFNWTPVPQPTNDPASEPDYQHWYPNPYIPSSEDERRLFSDSVVCFRQEEKNYKYRLEAPGQPLWNAIKAHCAAAAERYGVESNGTYNKKSKPCILFPPSNMTEVWEKNQGWDYRTYGNGWWKVQVAMRKRTSQYMYQTETC